MTKKVVCMHLTLSAITDGDDQFFQDLIVIMTGPAKVLIMGEFSLLTMKWEVEKCTSRTGKNFLGRLYENIMNQHIRDC